MVFFGNSAALHARGCLGRRILSSSNRGKGIQVAGHPFEEARRLRRANPFPIRLPCPVLIGSRTNGTRDTGRGNVDCTVCGGRRGVEFCNKRANRGAPTLGERSSGLRLSTERHHGSAGHAGHGTGHRLGRKGRFLADKRARPGATAELAVWGRSVDPTDVSLLCHLGQDSGQSQVRGSPKTHI